VDVLVSLGDRKISCKALDSTRAYIPPLPHSVKFCLHHWSFCVTGRIVAGLEIFFGFSEAMPEELLVILGLPLK
jgi:hypothetical protein